MEIEEIVNDETEDEAIETEEENTDEETEEETEDVPAGLTNDEFDILHTEPEEIAKPPPPEEPEVVEPTTEEPAAGTDLIAIIDAILGVNTDE